MMVSVAGFFTLENRTAAAADRLQHKKKTLLFRVNPKKNYSVLGALLNQLMSEEFNFA